MQLLHDLPDTPEHRQQIFLTDVALLAARIGATPPTTDDPVDTLDAYARALNLAGMGEMPHVSGLDPYASDRWSLRTSLGFHAGQVTQAAWTGNPPDTTSLIYGRFDPAATERAISTCAGCPTIDRRTYHDVSYYTHGRDFEVSIDRVMKPPGFDFLGRFGRLAVQEARIIQTYGTGAMERTIDAVQGMLHSLRDDEALSGLTERAITMGGDTLFLTVDAASQLASSRVRDVETNAKGDASLIQTALDPALLLRPYQTLLLGAGRDGPQMFMVVGLAHASEEAARENARILPERIAQTASFLHRDAWRNLVGVADVHTEGRFLMARLDKLAIRGLQFWHGWWVMKDTLLYYGAS